MFLFLKIEQIKLGLYRKFSTSDLFLIIHSAFLLYQEPFEDGLANGDEPSAAEEAAALMAKEAKGGMVKFGWVKGVLVSLSWSVWRKAGLVKSGPLVCWQSSAVGQ